MMGVFRRAGRGLFALAGHAERCRGQYLQSFRIDPPTTTAAATVAAILQSTQRVAQILDVRLGTFPAREGHLPVNAACGTLAVPELGTVLQARIQLSQFLFSLAQLELKLLDSR